MTMCKDFCDSFYSACSKLPAFGAEFALVGITDGTQLCEELEQIDPSGAKSATPHMDLMSIRKVEGEVPSLNIVVTDQDCFEGASVDVVGESECTPWEGNFEPYTYDSPADSPADSPGSPAGSPGSSNASPNEDNDDDRIVATLGIIG
eukprot:CAMPEP_0206207784 /NCGR_PEP_ID=MMETSP0166-20121206/15801_1 /ASSEMBLY_ACC=CAM_ASM_000260 /TAXON_ID=95228 /ORGANISM="Vannella robusta, Strain DIVA3 518/3/11/1/6" /LENGTH=147 /DNA_ID=CAMNT_0053628619 /DNA_START=215 /DNA_END=658 /DNA_ORIENTATION=+